MDLHQQSINSFGKAKNTLLNIMKESNPYGRLSYSTRKEIITLGHKGKQLDADTLETTTNQLSAYKILNKALAITLRNVIKTLMAV